MGHKTMRPMIVFQILKVKYVKNLRFGTRSAPRHVDYSTPSFFLSVFNETHRNKLRKRKGSGKMQKASLQQCPPNLIPPSWQGQHLFQGQTRALALPNLLDQGIKTITKTCWLNPFPCREGKWRQEWGGGGPGYSLRNAGAPE